VEKLLRKARIKGQETKQAETGKSSLDLRSAGTVGSRDGILFYDPNYRPAANHQQNL